MKDKGYAMVLDSIIALIFSLVVLAGLTGYYQFKSDDTSFKKLHYVSEDVFDVLNKEGVLDDVGEAWAASNGTNSTQWLSAQNMSTTYLEQLIPASMGYRLTVEDAVLVESNSSHALESDASSQTNSERLLVGYGKGLPTRGYVSRAYLTNIVEKTNSVYSYLGGFVGQGDITSYIRSIPEDAYIQQACFELNVGDAFDLYVNGVYAGHFTPSGSGMVANIKDSAGCVANPRTYFTTGDNKYELRFTGGDLNSKYVGGGYLKIVYNTTEADTEEEAKQQYDWMPGISGLVNYYSSVYVPGDITDMNLYLHFKNNHTTFMTVGDTVIFNSAENQSLSYCSITPEKEYNCTIPDANLSKKLYYSQMGEKTIPIRVGVGNVSSISNVDVMLVNDRSGSMRESGWVLINKTQPASTFINVSVPSDGWSSYSSFTINSSVKNLAAAINWGRKSGYNGSEGSNLVVNLRRPDGTWVFSEYSGKPNSAGNSVDPPDSVGLSNEYYSGVNTKPQALLIENPQAGTWRVAVYGWKFRPVTGPPSSMDVNISIFADTNLTTDDDLNKTDTVLSYLASQEAARVFVSQLAAEDHSGYVRFESSSLMAQGLTENKTKVEIAINNTGVGGGTAIQLGINDANDEINSHGRTGVNHIIILLTDGQNDAGPETVIQSANYAKNNGTKIFTIGLTAFVNEDMLRSVASKPEYYYYAPTAGDLQAIYNEISGVINETYRNQILNITSPINYTLLYEDSYLKTGYTPNEDSGYGELSFTTSTPPFDDVVNCKGYLYVPDDVEISDAKVTSYSSDHWTDFLSVENSEYHEPYKLWYDYGALSYSMLGDPYLVYVPVEYLPSAVNNTLKIETGDSQTTRTSCSADDRAIYTIRLKMMVEYGDVFANADGCQWAIEFEDGSTMNAIIPETYNGTKQCYYTSTNMTSSSTDTIDDSVYRLMRHLDIDRDGRVDVLFDPARVGFETSRAGGVKSLWGPAKFKLILWM